jgi:hypothetical protein
MFYMGMFLKIENCEERGILYSGTVSTTVNVFRDFKTRHGEHTYYCNIQERAQLISMTDSS